MAKNKKGSAKTEKQKQLNPSGPTSSKAHQVKAGNPNSQNGTQKKKTVPKLTNTTQAKPGQVQFNDRKRSTFWLFVVLVSSGVVLGTIFFSEDIQRIADPFIQEYLQPYFPSIQQGPSKNIPFDGEGLEQNNTGQESTKVGEQPENIRYDGEDVQQDIGQQDPGVAEESREGDVQRSSIAPGQSSPENLDTTGGEPSLRKRREEGEVHDEDKPERFVEEVTRVDEDDDADSSQMPVMDSINVKVTPKASTSASQPKEDLEVPSTLEEETSGKPLSDQTKQSNEKTPTEPNTPVGKKKENSQKETEKVKNGEKFKDSQKKMEDELIKKQQMMDSEAKTEEGNKEEIIKDSKKKMDEEGRKQQKVKDSESKNKEGKKEDKQKESQTKMEEERRKASLTKEEEKKGEEKRKDSKTKMEDGKKEDKREESQTKMEEGKKEEKRKDSQTKMEEEKREESQTKTEEGKKEEKRKDSQTKMEEGKKENEMRKDPLTKEEGKKEEEKRRDPQTEMEGGKEEGKSKGPQTKTEEGKERKKNIAPVKAEEGKEEEKRNDSQVKMQEEKGKDSQTKREQEKRKAEEEKRNNSQMKMEEKKKNSETKVKVEEGKKEEENRKNSPSVTEEEKRKDLPSKLVDGKKVEKKDTTPAKLNEGNKKEERRKDSPIKTAEENEKDEKRDISLTQNEEGKNKDVVEGKERKNEPQTKVSDEDPKKVRAEIKEKIADEEPSRTQVSQESPSPTHDTDRATYKYSSITNDGDFLIREELDEADALLENEKLEEAIKKYDALLWTHLESPRAYWGKGRALDKLGFKYRSNEHLEQAILFMDRVMVLPNVPDDLLKMCGRHLADRQQFRGWGTQAVITFKSLTQKFPNDLELWKEFGVNYMMIGQNEQARDVFKHILDKDPGSGFAKAHLGFIMKTADNDLERAVELLQAGLESGEKGTVDGRFFLHLGDSLLRLGREEQARKIFQEGEDKDLFLSAWQRSLYNVKRLTARPWWTPEQTGYQRHYKLLEDNWRTIRDEGLAQLNTTTGSFVPEEENLRDTGDWRQFTLYQQGRKNKKNCGKVPKTCALLDQIPEAAECTRGQIKFSVMSPGIHVWPHTGPTNCRLRSHLGLVIPEGPVIRVVNETRQWTEGKFLIFDDSFEHEVWHEGSELRLVFIVDFWHPELGVAERKKLSPI